MPDRHISTAAKQQAAAYAKQGGRLRGRRKFGMDWRTVKAWREKAANREDPAHAPAEGDGGAWAALVDAYAPAAVPGGEGRIVSFAREVVGFEPTPRQAAILEEIERDASQRR